MKSYKKIRDDVYYSELQAALRSYDTKLWQIPSLFIIVVSLFLNRKKFDFSSSLENCLIAFFVSTFLLILILLDIAI